MAEPKDIALAIRIPPSVHTEDPDAQSSPAIVEHSGYTREGPETDHTEVEMEFDELEEMFDGVGMEFLDETAPLEEDDERRMSLVSCISSPRHLYLHTEDRCRYEQASSWG